MSKISQIAASFIFRFSCALYSARLVSFGFFSKRSRFSLSHAVVAKPRARHSCSPRMPKPIMPSRTGLPLIAPEAGGGEALMFKVSSRNFFSRIASPASFAPEYQTAPSIGIPPRVFKTSRLFQLFKKLLSFAMMIKLNLFLPYALKINFRYQILMLRGTRKSRTGPPSQSGFYSLSNSFLLMGLAAKMEKEDVPGSTTVTITYLQYNPNVPSNL